MKRKTQFKLGGVLLGFAILFFTFASNNYGRTLTNLTFLNILLYIIGFTILGFSIYKLVK